MLAWGSWSQSSDSLDVLTIRNISIEGNRKTKPHIITCELSFAEGEQYQRFQLDSMFEWDQNRIYNTNLFNEITFSYENEYVGTTDIKITVDERWYFYPIPIFKLADRNFNDWWVNQNRDFSRVNVGLRITQYNFRGRAERLRVDGQFGFETLLSLSYKIPYIEKTQKHGLSIDLTYWEAKNLAYNTENNNRIFLRADDLLRTVSESQIIHQYRSSFYSFHFFTMNHINVHVADTITTLNPNYLGDGRTNQKYFTLGYNYAWDKRNNRNYPTEGEWYIAGISKFGLGIHGDVDFWALNFRLNKYKDLGKDFYYSGNLNGLISFPDDRSYFNFFSIGFKRKVLRGFDLTVIEGSNFVIQKNEFKKALFRHTQDISRFMPIRQFQTCPITIFGKVFFDSAFASGYPGHDGSNSLTDKYIYSYGAGIDLMVIYDAVFRFELSRNSLGETNFFVNFGAPF